LELYIFEFLEKYGSLVALLEGHAVISSKQAENGIQQSLETFISM
jgi:hypothetical protein